MGSVVPGERDAPDRDGALKQKTARLSVVSNTFLVAAKLAVGISIGSVAIISEAIHSAIDLVAAVVAYFSVRQSARPPDECHAFGHGKYESISGLLEAVLILVAAVLIINEAAGTLLGGGEGGLNVEALGLGIAVMLLSAVVNFYVSSRLMTVAKATESIALESDAWHLRTDVYTSAGVVVGLVLIRLTGLVILDALIALVVAVIILRAAFDLIRRSLEDLVDRSLPPEEEARIREVITAHCTAAISFHRLRTRRSGPNRFVDFHLVVPRTATIEEAYGIAREVEADLRRELPRMSVTVRVQPCTGEDCPACGIFTTCPECDRLTFCDKGSEKK
ncbi:cation transporter [Methanoculleus sp. Wushi-C6]|uniref:Cation transporter n=1 Tax=Methanoculleus caldifontis TaxID=2651577 RepID=A0ABU3X0E5_9EURY|nr:cation diffusion facilitator family transporter [Methanoculleus sp. Wushi-C6]MDV2481508.1 cation transporter [Methanoculleus sp. Wushi-C6]